MGWSHICMWWIKIREGYLGSEESQSNTRPPVQGSSARKVSPHNFWLQKLVGTEEEMGLCMPNGKNEVSSVQAALCGPSGTPGPCWCHDSDKRWKWNDMNRFQRVRAETDTTCVGSDMWPGRDRRQVLVRRTWVPTSAVAGLTWATWKTSISNKGPEKAGAASDLT